MPILVHRQSKIIVQGAGGLEGRFHAAKMREYGTRVVAGVDPGATADEMDGMPLYRRIGEVIREHGPMDASVVFVPAPFVLDAVAEAVHHGIKLVVLITEGVPLRDAVHLVHLTQARGTRLIGPNGPGLIVPGEAKLGIIPGHIVEKGPVGVISRSGTLTYEVIQSLGKQGIGQSACIGIGGDPCIGTRFTDLLRLFEEDEATRAVVLIGEIGGNDERKAADFIQAHVTKPVVAFIAGQCAPPEKKMGHAGAIISSEGESAGEKIAYLKSKGVSVADIPGDIGALVKSALAG